MLNFAEFPLHTMPAIILFHDNILDTYKFEAISMCVYMSARRCQAERGVFIISQSARGITR